MSSMTFHNRWWCRAVAAAVFHAAKPRRRRTRRCPTWGTAEQRGDSGDTGDRGQRARIYQAVPVPARVSPHPAPAQRREQLKRGQGKWGQAAGDRWSRREAGVLAPVPGVPGVPARRERSPHRAPRRDESRSGRRAEAQLARERYQTCRGGGIDNATPAALEGCGIALPKVEGILAACRGAGRLGPRPLR
jgi:hypothetical protein